MSWLSLADIAEMTGGSLLGGRTQNADVNAVSIDTRKVQPDDLFIAIKGERFDAHNFVDGLEGKVAGALVSKEIDCNVPQVLVEDTKLALAQLALAWRKRFKEVVIGLTGSNGKTTLKEMISAILSQEGNVLATLGNLNNDIGMPLTLLRLREEHDYAVIEMGANHFGEIDFLADIAKPNIAVINNAGPAHLEGFGDIEGVSRAKGEIFNGLVDDGIAIVNADDDYADYWKGLNSDKQVITFGLNNSADISGDYKGNGLLLIKINQSQSHPRSQTQQQVQLNLQGKHNAMNALAATAVATALGVELQTVKIGLESLAVVPGRLAMVEGLHGSKILDDTYNANPASANAAIEVLAEASGIRMMVLGDMGELGGDVEAMHGAIGTKAKDSGIEKMFCYGTYSAKACEQFGSPETAFSEMDELIFSIKSSIKNSIKNSIKSNIESNTRNESETDMTTVMTILVKGSRSARMERVVDALKTGEVERC